MKQEVCIEPCNLLLTIEDIFKGINISEKQEEIITNKIKDIFHIKPNEINDFSSIKNYLNSLRKKMDSEIVNAPFTRELNIESVKILFSSGDLLFGIPKIITDTVDELNEVKFIYILDEYERFSQSQKIFLNTLVFDKKMPCTFWIGARKYGFTVFETKSSEPIRAGSEYQPFEIDKFFKDNPHIYKAFAENLFINRLSIYYCKKDKNLSKEEIKNSFIKKFIKYDEQLLLDQIKNKNPNGNYAHIKNLNKKLNSGFKKKCLYGIEKKEQIDEIIKSLLIDTDDNPLYQKYKIFSFYQKWNNSKLSIQKIVGDVNEQFKLFLQDNKSEFKNVKEKYKLDFLAQLSSENKIKNIYYSGLEKFIDISWGNPRVFLLTWLYTNLLFHAKETLVWLAQSDKSRSGI